MRAFTLMLGALLAGCSVQASSNCVRSETGGEFTSNVDGEGRLFYSCPKPPSCRSFDKDIHGNPLYTCNH